ncbi:hypothetical protein KOEU_38920 [Komagataeibacter europaeus]|uniref:Uncharacterized protein n=1 Tax=Komagataeibacter europaeus TaxID=33995 RepID=A0A0M0EBJ1_KOMEU|nr:hypothetical protein [Komagataeibacter europaeus]KON62619.1 hypothetical protein KOEU_38920 [Komagataeibacter europaeus]
MKAMFKGWLTLVSVFGLLVVVMDPARADMSTDLTDVISSLPPGFVAWLGVITGVLYALAQLRAVLPPSVTARIPSILMRLLDLVAANYKHARNVAPAKVADSVDWDRGPSNDEYRQIVETAKSEGKVRGSRIENSGDSPGVDNSGRKGA